MSDLKLFALTPTAPTYRQNIPQCSSLFFSAQMKGRLDAKAYLLMVKKSIIRPCCAEDPHTAAHATA